MLPVWVSDIRGALWCFVASTIVEAAGWRRCGRGAALILTPVCAVGLVFSGAFYWHTTRTVFNRRPPLLRLRPFFKHMMVTRPLEAVWRFITAPLRELPDFYVLGETRTGTTTFAAHLRRLGCSGPFSPWIVPLASDKESFYFAGHYFGVVLPSLYRMCFPLRCRTWFRRRLSQQPVAIFDACASYLNAPWAASLIRRATPNAVLVVMLRPPAEQNASWWRLESGAHMWARSMGLGEDFMVKGYPPPSFKAALEYSRSESTLSMYREGEQLGQQGSASLPQRLLPFPGGQLGALDSMGRYADNIKRYVDLFGKDKVLFLETRDMSTHEGVTNALHRLGTLVPAVAELLAAHPGTAPKGEDELVLNSSPSLPSELLPDEETLRDLRQYYREHNQRLYRIVGQDLGWE